MQLSSDDIDYSQLAHFLISMSPTRRRLIRHLVELMTDGRKRNYFYVAALAAAGILMLVAYATHQNPLVTWGIAISFLVLGALAVLKFFHLL